MTGVRLEAKVHIVTGAVASAQNIIKCANRTGLNVADIVLQPLASSRGGARRGREGARRLPGRHRRRHHRHRHLRRTARIVHTAVLALGGNHLTNDIAVGLRTPGARGRADQAAATAARWPRWSTRTRRSRCPASAAASRACWAAQILCEILEPRVEEIFQLVQREIQKCGFEELLACGRGHHRRLDAARRACPSWPRRCSACRCGAACPRGIGGLVDVVKSPMYATGVGLVVYGAKHQDRRMFRIREENVYREGRRAACGSGCEEIF